MICGVDEAGRGPVIGPLVVAGVKCENDIQLKEIQVRDSKKYTPIKRTQLAEKIKRIILDTKAINSNSWSINNKN